MTNKTMLIVNRFDEDLYKLQGWQHTWISMNHHRKQRKCWYVHACMPAKWIHYLQMSICTSQRLACSTFSMKRIRPVKWSRQWERWCHYYYWTIMIRADCEMVTLPLLDLLWDGVITIFGLSWFILNMCQLWDGVITIHGFMILTVWVLSFYIWQVKLCYWKFNRFHAFCIIWSNLFSLCCLCSSYAYVKMLTCSTPTSNGLLSDYEKWSTIV